MPRPGEDRSDVGGAAQFNNIGPVPLSSVFVYPNESERLTLKEVPFYTDTNYLFPGRLREKTN